MELKIGKIVQVLEFEGDKIIPGLPEIRLSMP
jgi:hypothetical protein